MTVVARVSFLANEVVGGWVVEELVVLQKWVSALGESLGSFVLGLEKMMVEKFDVLQKWKSAEHLHFQKASLPRLSGSPPHSPPPNLSSSHWGSGA